MTEKEMQKLAGIVLNQLEQKEKREMMSAQTIFRKTELLLKKYKSFKKRIRVLNQQLENVQLRKCVTFGEIRVENKEYLSEYEKIENKKIEIKKSIGMYEAVISLIEQGLESIKDDKYYSIIEMRYLDRVKIEEIAEKIGVDESTVKRNKNRLIDEISLVIFETEILKDIFKNFL
ncbi:hypothetical protein A2U07_08820 [Fusobacterium necrophorum subsp. funduliforme]|uniref:sigma factor-like helix-turn-helix DNA-binding protein n=1 Tax=Fusobacterium necrophorum TaxID=859 RepID=UPI000788E789|nr:sigma factor-like helix-turn-helix DNA-binding protein [Fusobacterium necrophorum]KYM57619.1 hypothetical protein A2U07_08820 [Fusobacterium necrophorum subsp. funduliforme]